MGSKTNDQLQKLEEWLIDRQSVYEKEYERAYDADHGKWIEERDDLLVGEKGGLCIAMREVLAKIAELKTK